MSLPSDSADRFLRAFIDAVAAAPTTVGAATTRLQKTFPASSEAMCALVMATPDVGELVREVARVWRDGGQPDAFEDLARTLGVMSQVMSACGLDPELPRQDPAVIAAFEQLSGNDETVKTAFFCHTVRGGIDGDSWCLDGVLDPETPIPFRLLLRYAPVAATAVRRIQPDAALTVAGLSAWADTGLGALLDGERRTHVPAAVVDADGHTLRTLFDMFVRPFSQGGVTYATIDALMGRFDVEAPAVRAACAAVVESAVPSTRIRPSSPDILLRCGFVQWAKFQPNSPVFRNQYPTSFVASLPEGQKTVRVKGNLLHFIAGEASISDDMAAQLARVLALDSRFDTLCEADESAEPSSADGRAAARLSPLAASLGLNHRARVAHALLSRGWSPMAHDGLAWRPLRLSLETEQGKDQELDALLRAWAAHHRIRQISSSMDSGPATRLSVLPLAP